MKEKILELLEKHTALSVKQLEEELGITSAKDFTAMMKTLNALEEDRKIFLNEKEAYEIASQKNQSEGTLIVRRNGSAFVSYKGQLIEVVNQKKAGGLNGDEILFKVYGHTATIVKILKHNIVYVVGIIRIHKDHIQFIPDDSSLPFGLKITNLNEFKLKDYTKVRCYIDDYHKMTMRIESIIGDARSPEVKELSILYSYDVSTEFDSTTLNEAAALKDEVRLSDYPDRHDCTGELIITIDGDDAKDFDDAISLRRTKTNGYLLKVHIADVSHYVKENSAIDVEAYQRGTSIYYPGHVIPMLPFELSDDLCSLVPGQNRLAMTCEMEYDENGNQLRYDIYESVIKSTHRMTYNKVNAILDSDQQLINEYSDIVPMIMDSYDLSQKINALHHQSGGIDFQSDECKIIQNKKGEVIDVLPASAGLSEGIIECFMIEANVTVASHMKYLDYPMVYRNHDYPKPDRISTFYSFVEGLGYTFKGNKAAIYSKQLADCLNSFEGRPEYPIVSNFLLRSMAKAVYSNQSEGHFGLGLDNYCHFTSPIRRYPDLQVHRMLKKYCIKTPDFSGMEADYIHNGEVAEQSSKREVVATKIERDITDLKKCEYMKNHIGDVWQGVISSTTTFGFYVKLENTIEGLVHVKTLDGFFSLQDDGSLTNGEKSYQIGQVVKVKCDKVDVLNQNIDFILLEKRSRNHRQYDDKRPQSQRRKRYVSSRRRHN